MKCADRVLFALLCIATCFIYFMLVMSSSESVLSEDQSQEKGGQSELAQRKELLDEKCRIFQDPFRAESKHVHAKDLAELNSFQYFNFNDEYTMVCSIQKAGSNSMHNFLRKVLQAQVNKKVRKKKPLFEVEDNHFEFPLNAQCWPSCAKNVTKVILVRHPLDRLLSTFLYIFANKNGKYYDNKYSWEEFVANIIHYPEDEGWRDLQSGVGNHWEPYWRVCQVCDQDLRPDYVLKLESVQQDLETYLKDIGLADYAKKFPWSNPNQNSNVLFRRHDYYSRLNKSTIEQLYLVYKVDHDLFGYDPEPFLRLGF